MNISHIRIPQLQGKTFKGIEQYFDSEHWRYYDGIKLLINSEPTPATFRIILMPVKYEFTWADMYIHEDLQTNKPGFHEYTLRFSDFFLLQTRLPLEYNSPRFRYMIHTRLIVARYGDDLPESVFEMGPVEIFVSRSKYFFWR